MQTAEKIATNGLEELLRKVAKLERVAELATQLRETYGDKFASYNEKQYVLEKLDESLQEYELFLNN
tara:strand:- start:1980 stop:2180 length:201 start_codon:yes stop_codon:yes gene_type:complete